MKKIAILYLFFWSLLLPQSICHAQLAWPVTDPTNTATGFIIKFIQDANELIRETMLPLKDNIAAISDFFKDAKGLVNASFKNLALLNDIASVRTKINDEFLETLYYVDQMEDLPQARWKYRWQLAQMYYHSRNLFNVFEVSSKDGSQDGNQGTIMDDKDRIHLLKKVYKELKSTYLAIRTTKRRMQKQEQILKRQKREIETFVALFQQN